MSRRVLLLAGLTASAVYVVTVVVGGFITPGYSHTSDFISSLIQSGASRKALLDPPFLVYNVLLVGFGAGLLGEVDRMPGLRSRAGRVGALSIVTVGLAGVVMFWFPQDPVGTPVSPGGTIHIILAAVASLATMVAMGTLARWWSGRQAAKAFARFSYIALALVFVAGYLAAVAAARLHPPTGLVQRFTIGSFIAWLAVASWVLAESRRPPIERDAVPSLSAAALQ
jgi:hypothetical protein